MAYRSTKMRLPRKFNKTGADSSRRPPPNSSEILGF